ncbi:single-stranded DNA-binding protein [Mucilaginibacter aquaedulcis]|uniref:single-stranded DNA-binding protein n=1 Tax=Mucilaginibacter aquaedulcis TaxID=1187081 RepID=UPI0025B3699B|nr:single-stranded DNA-binding protein [Mucilaginibacter aquaedulcis]MDN3550216.1 single-stranded DNA-binding protein [Mucilaginibacter aquaedulcis]
MSGINKVILVGHVGNTPNLRYLEDHVAVTGFELVTAESISEDGKKSQHLEWHHVVMWRTLAKQGALKLKKGKLVCVEGRLQTRSFEDKKGIKKQITEIVAQHFRVLGSDRDAPKVRDQYGLNNRP